MDPRRRWQKLAAHDHQLPTTIDLTCKQAAAQFWLPTASPPLHATAHLLAENISLRLACTGPRWYTSGKKSGARCGHIFVSCPTSQSCDSAHTVDNYVSPERPKQDQRFISGELNQESNTYTEACEDPLRLSPLDLLQVQLWRRLFYARLLTARRSILRSPLTFRIRVVPLIGIIKAMPNVLASIALLYELGGTSFSIVVGSLSTGTELHDVTT